jgi:hypothetical protein
MKHVDIFFAADDWEFLRGLQEGGSVVFPRAAAFALGVTRSRFRLFQATPSPPQNNFKKI